ncbi:hypothetical protein AURDEDRAFT_175197 [Auricularia subglabra TFB-10046 SS5]|nr:hypothetical protein AURDEDRAFT_175197 [Auricularia subglabra TFB-10046 SS5]
MSTEQVTIESFVLLDGEDSMLHSWAEVAFLATVDIHAMLNTVVTSTGVTARLDSDLNGDLWCVNVDPRDTSTIFSTVSRKDLPEEGAESHGESPAGRTNPADAGSPP